MSKENWDGKSGEENIFISYGGGYLISRTNQPGSQDTA